MGQSFSEYELLLVDDGSTDGSGYICDDYARKDNRIRVFHKENGGVSSARNLGIDESKGEFVVFVDADDYLEEYYLEHLLSSDSDLVVSGYQKFEASSESVVPSKYEVFKVEHLPTYWNTPPNMNYLYCFPFGKLFSTEIIRKNNIRFNESLFFSEDMCFNMVYMSHIDTLSNIPYVDYKYRLAPLSRDEKFKLSASQLKNHYEYFEECLNNLYGRIGDKTLSFVRDNTHLRMMRKFFSYLSHCKSVAVFSQNISLFKKEPWSKHLMSLLIGRREKRVMKEAMLAPVLTFYFEIRFRNQFVLRSK